jgi:nucleoside-diphosphate-sugar epimerase
MGNWLVVGGSGFIGSALCEEIQRSGHVVVSLPAPRLAIDPSASALEILATARREAAGPSGAALEAEFAGVDVVINAAGRPHPDSRSDPELFGANALLPVLLALACQSHGVPRYVHLSSAAVQGRSPRLDDSRRRHPFSPYSLSKARGEEALEILAESTKSATSVGIIRATSVQGEGRATTENLYHFARSRLASVAFPGTAPSPVSFVSSLATFVVYLGEREEPLPLCSVQPWEGLSVHDVLTAFGASRPTVLPQFFCRSTVTMFFALARVGLTRFSGLARRLEVLWFGQKVDSTFSLPLPSTLPPELPLPVRAP